MKPITFSCTETVPLSPEDIARQILDLAKWTDFKGYGVLPGIKEAAFEVRTPAVVGTRIKATSTDGSSHVEEIVEWEPERRLRLDMKDFSPPLSRLATGFVETWTFERLGNGIRVTRSFKMHPKSLLARPVARPLADLVPAQAGRRPAPSTDAGWSTAFRRCSPVSRTSGVVTLEDFERLDIRVGRVVDVQPFPRAGTRRISS